MVIISCRGVGFPSLDKLLEYHAYINTYREWITNHITNEFISLKGNIGMVSPIHLVFALLEIVCQYVYSF